MLLIKSYFFLPIDIPQYCWIVHLVNYYNKMTHTCCFHQHSMFSCLSSTLKPCFKLTTTCRYHLNKTKVLGYTHKSMVIKDDLNLQKLFPLHNLCYSLHNLCCNRSQFELTKTATSAWEAPPIMLGTKLLWPGASKIVKCFSSVSKKALPTSTVLPLSLSSALVSNAQERYLK